MSLPFAFSPPPPPPSNSSPLWDDGLLVTFHTTGGHPIVVAALNRLPTLVSRDILFSWRKLWTGEQRFFVKGRELQAGRWMLGVFNMDYYEHTGFEYYISVDTANLTGKILSPFASVGFGVTASLFLFAMFSVFRRILWERHMARCVCVGGVFLCVVCWCVNVSCPNTYIDVSTTTRCVHHPYQARLYHHLVTTFPLYPLYLCIYVYISVYIYIYLPPPPLRMAMEHGGALPLGFLPGVPLPPRGVPQHIIDSFPSRPFKAEDFPDSPSARRGEEDEERWVFCWGCDGCCVMGV